MIPVRTVRTLEVAAASGLFSTGGRLYVVGDDELGLSVFAADGGRFLETIPLFAGELPRDHAARKRDKPDLEALALLPGDDLAERPPMLLAMGSGSRPNRARGAIVRLDGRREVSALDLSALYQALERELPDLNIEGAAVVGGSLRLLQRGNGAARLDAVVDLDLAGVLAAVGGAPSRLALGAGVLRGVLRVALGELDGVPLSFTDASPLAGGRLLFTAAAEDTIDTYADGACAGSVVGVLGPSGEVEWTDRLETPLKIEGVHASPRADGAIELLLVADADDPGVPSPLLAATVRR